MTRRLTTPIRLSEAGSRKRIIISERIIHIIHIRLSRLRVFSSVTTRDSSSKFDSPLAVPSFQYYFRLSEAKAVSKYPCNPCNPWFPKKSVVPQFRVSALPRYPRFTFDTLKGRFTALCTAFCARRHSPAVSAAVPASLPSGT